MNDTYYNQPHLLIEQVIDDDEIIPLSEEDWSNMDMNCLEEEALKTFKKSYSIKTGRRE